MKRFVVEISSGSKVEVNAPIVATEQEVIAYVQSHEDKYDNRRQKERDLSQVRQPFREVKLRADEIIWDWDGQAFAEHIKNTFVPSLTDEEWIDAQWWVKWWEQIRQGLLVVTVGVLFLWILTWSIGWIVRGFLGIPRGQDSKGA